MDEKTEMRGFDRKKSGKILIAISFLCLLIGTVGIGVFESAWSVSLIFISIAALAGGFVWYRGKNPGEVPAVYAVIGLCFMLAWIWTGVVSGNVLWILLGILLPILWMLLVIGENPAMIKGKPGEAD